MEQTFQPTLPMRGATTGRTALSQHGFISTHAPHAGSDPPWVLRDCLRKISTHAPHAGSDCRYKQKRIFNFVYMRQITEPL